MRCSDCESEETCGIRLVMKDVRDAMANILDNTSLADVIAMTEKAKGTESNNPLLTIAG
jgi:DNA-binding IscR family transcriptional regulator